jgi:hypothetical protein
MGHVRVYFAKALVHLIFIEIPVPFDSSKAMFSPGCVAAYEVSLLMFVHVFIASLCCARYALKL